MRKISWKMVLAGGIIGAISVLLVVCGNPANMGYCIACFLRDIAGSFGFHQAAVVQYLRPEIMGLVLGAFLLALVRKEFRPRAGSAPVVRFLLGAVVMIGALAFLGCPVRMMLRLAGGDVTALAGLAGYLPGVGIGVLFLNKGFSLGRAYTTKPMDGAVMPGLAIVLTIAAFVVPTLFITSTAGPGSLSAPIFLSLGAGIVVGIIMGLSRFCSVGGIRDVLLMRDWNLATGLIGFFLVALIGNLLTGNFKPDLAIQPIAHRDYLWSALGMMAVGWGSVLLGGCPMRQLVLAGQGNGDSAITVLGLMAGAALSHNWGLAGAAESAESAGGVSSAGEIAVAICLVVLLVVSLVNLERRKNHD